MAKSILQDNKECYICGGCKWLECHHVYGGANRKKSEQYGLKVWLCHNHHNEPPNGVHFNIQANHQLKATAQLKAMAHYGWSINDFRSVFGKNYL